MILGRRTGARLRELDRASDADAVELYVAHRLGYPIPGGSGSADWDRLHAWERELLLRGERAIAARNASDLVERLEVAAVAIVAAMLGGEPAAAPPPAPAAASLGAPTARGKTFEDRAAELAGKISAAGGVVPAASDEPAAARSPLGITVREV